MSRSLGAALVLELDDEALAALAERLAPFMPEPVKRGDAPVETTERLLTAAEAAERAAVHVETIRRAVRDGQLAAGRAGRSLRIDPADLSAWLSDSVRARPRWPQRSRAGRRRASRRPLTDALAQLES